MNEEILKKIDAAILTEEKAIPIYTKHIGNTLFWSGLGKKTQEDIKKTFIELKEDSGRHVKQLQSIKEMIKGQT